MLEFVSKGITIIDVLHFDDLKPNCNELYTLGMFLEFAKNVGRGTFFQSA